jgi:hypothetical protein
MKGQEDNPAGESGISASLQEAERIWKIEDKKIRR